MAVNEITPEEREQMMEKAMKNMKIKRQHLSREELEKEVIDYLSKKQPCSLATCGKDCAPRISVVDYVNDGLTIYIISEGGDKFKNLKENNRVAVGIGTGAKALKTRGVNIWGIADVFADGDPEFENGIKLFKTIFEEMAKTMGMTSEIPLPRDILRLIRVTPTRMVYHHTMKGIKHARWEIDP
jgi:uncharacterized pyridoxamine 5'-phosphate oxidase family protein